MNMQKDFKIRDEIWNLVRIEIINRTNQISIFAGVSHESKNGRRGRRGAQRTGVRCLSRKSWYVGHPSGAEIHCWRVRRYRRSHSRLESEHIQLRTLCYTEYSDNL